MLAGFHGDGGLGTCRPAACQYRAGHCHPLDDDRRESETGAPFEVVRGDELAGMLESGRILWYEMDGEIPGPSGNGPFLQTLVDPDSGIPLVPARKMP